MLDSERCEDIKRGCEATGLGCDVTGTQILGG